MQESKLKEYYLKIRAEIKKANFEAAIDKLEELIKELPKNLLDVEFLSLSARYNVLRKNSNLGIITDENERNSLIHSLINILNEAKQIAEDAPQLITNTEEWSQSEKNDEIYGDPNHFVVLFKVVSDNLKKSTKAMELDNGSVIQVTTERRSPDGAWSVAEAVSFIPNARIVRDDPKSYNGKGKSGRVGYHLEYNNEL